MSEPSRWPHPGGLRPGDTLIQNGADLPTGQAVIQLCKLLKIRTINLVADDDGFEATQALLKGMGGSLVLRDNARRAAHTPRSRTPPLGAGPQE